MVSVTPCDRPPSPPATAIQRPASASATPAPSGKATTTGRARRRSSARMARCAGGPRKMLPVDARLDFSDGAFRDAVVFCDGRLWTRVAQNRSDSIRGKARRAGSFAAGVTVLALTVYDIFCSGAEEQMVRPDAFGIVAAVAHESVCRNVAVVQRIGNARRCGAAAVDFEATVAGQTFMSYPLPAA